MSRRNRGTVFFLPVLFEPSVFQQRGSRRLFTAEVHVHHVSIVDTAGGEDILAELIGRCTVEDIACFLKCFEGVGIEHLRPDVAVIAGGISTSHRMIEVGAAISGWDLRKRFATRHRFVFEFQHIETVGDFLQDVVIHIEVRGLRIFSRDESLSVLAALIQLVDEFLWYVFARLVMFGVDFQDFGLEHPMFHHL